MRKERAVQLLREYTTRDGWRESERQYGVTVFRSEKFEVSISDRWLCIINLIKVNVLDGNTLIVPDEVICAMPLRKLKTLYVGCNRGGNYLCLYRNVPGSDEYYKVCID